MFIYREKTLTINKQSLNSEESNDLKILVSLGDSENLALWTIEHINRHKSYNYEFYRFAYES